MDRDYILRLFDDSHPSRPEVLEVNLYDYKTAARITQLAKKGQLMIQVFQVKTTEKPL